MNKKSLAFLLLFVFMLIPVIYGCESALEEHIITVFSSNIQEGSVNGDGIYKTNQPVTLKAEEAPGSTFVAWIKNNVEVSVEKTYSFIANKNTQGKYTAVFASNNNNKYYFKLNGIALSYKHLLNLQNYEVLNVNITKIKLDFKALNTTTDVNIYEEELNIEVLREVSTTDTIEVASNFYLSKLKQYYLTTKIFYTVNDISAYATNTILIDLSAQTYKTNENISYVQMIQKIKNTTLDVDMAFILYPAGLQMTQNLIEW